MSINDHSICSRIVSIGSYLPRHKVLNSDLSQFPASALSLIEQKTGVKQRFHAAPDECTSDMGAEAAKTCIEQAGYHTDQIECIILATSSPDRSIPATATRIQHLLGAVNACAFDINSVCSGAVYALQIADSLIRSNQYNNVLVVASEVYSRILNPNDFSTFPYFGDGAGAILLTKSTDLTGPRIVRSLTGSDGSGANLIQVPAGGTMLPFWKSTPKQQYFTMNGRAVFNFAVQKGVEVILKMIKFAEIDKSDISHVVVHQANINIVNSIAAQSGIERSKFFVNLNEVGNTAGASVLIALDALWKANTVQVGEKVLVVAFGGGLSWGSNLIQC